MAARVSAIITTFNRAHLVGDAIRGALAQSYTEREVLVVDDGSTDETAAVVASFGPAIRYLPQANQGVVAARNRGAAEASGELLYFLDSDDVPRPEALRLLVALMETDPATALTYGRAEVVDPSGHLLRTYQPGYARPEGVWPGVRELEHLLLSNYITPGACLLRRSAWEAAGGFDAATGGAFEDWDLWTRIARHGAIGYTPQVVLTVRDQPQSENKRFTPDRYLSTKRHMIDTAFADAEIAGQLAPARARIEGIYHYDVAWMAYSTHDVARARAELRHARHIYPSLLGDAEAHEARWLALRLRLPRAATELARALKRRGL